jgi:hypothetical protein
VVPPRAICTDRAADARNAKGAALPPGRAVPTEPPHPVMRREQRYPPGQLISLQMADYFIIF